MTNSQSRDLTIYLCNGMVPKIGIEVSTKCSSSGVSVSKDTTVVGSKKVTVQVNLAPPGTKEEKEVTQWLQAKSLNPMLCALKFKLQWAHGYTKPFLVQDVTVGQIAMGTVAITQSGYIHNTYITVVRPEVCDWYGYNVSGEHKGSIAGISTQYNRDYIPEESITISPSNKNFKDNYGSNVTLPYGPSYDLRGSDQQATPNPNAIHPSDLNQEYLLPVGKNKKSISKGDYLTAFDGVDSWELMTDNLIPGEKITLLHHFRKAPDVTLVDYYYTPTLSGGKILRVYPSTISAPARYDIDIEGTTITNINATDWCPYTVGDWVTVGKLDPENYVYPPNPFVMGSKSKRIAEIAVSDSTNLKELNEYRKKYSATLSTLNYDGVLYTLAKKYADELILNGFVSHRDMMGRTAAERYQLAGNYPEFYAENLAAYSETAKIKKININGIDNIEVLNTPSIDKFISLWDSSPPHKEHMVSDKIAAGAIAWSIKYVKELNEVYFVSVLLSSVKTSSASTVRIMPIKPNMTGSMQGDLLDISGTEKISNVRFMLGRITALNYNDESATVEISYYKPYEVNVSSTSGYPNLTSKVDIIKETTIDIITDVPILYHCNAWNSTVQSTRYGFPGGGSRGFSAGDIVTIVYYGKEDKPHASNMVIVGKSLGPHVCPPRDLVVIFDYVRDKGLVWNTKNNNLEIIKDRVTGNNVYPPYKWSVLIAYYGDLVRIPYTWSFRNPMISSIADSFAGTVTPNILVGLTDAKPRIPNGYEIGRSVRTNLPLVGLSEGGTYITYAVDDPKTGKPDATILPMESLSSYMAGSIPYYPYDSAVETCRVNHTSVMYSLKSKDLVPANSGLYYCDFATWPLNGDGRETPLETPPETKGLSDGKLVHFPDRFDASIRSTVQPWQVATTAIWSGYIERGPDIYPTYIYLVISMLRGSVFSADNSVAAYYDVILPGSTARLFMGLFTKDRPAPVKHPVSVSGLYYKGFTGSYDYTANENISIPTFNGNGIPNKYASKNQVRGYTVDMHPMSGVTTNKVILVAQHVIKTMRWLSTDELSGNNDASYPYIEGYDKNYIYDNAPKYRGFYRKFQLTFNRNDPTYNEDTRTESYNEGMLTSINEKRVDSALASYWSDFLLPIGESLRKSIVDDPNAYKPAAPDLSTDSTGVVSAVNALRERLGYTRLKIAKNIDDILRAHAQRVGDAQPSESDPNGKSINEKLIQAGVITVHGVLTAYNNTGIPVTARAIVDSWSETNNNTNYKKLIAYSDYDLYAACVSRTWTSGTTLYWSAYMAIASFEPYVLPQLLLSDKSDAMAFQFYTIGSTSMILPPQPGSKVNIVATTIASYNNVLGGWSKYKIEISAYRVGVKIYYKVGSQITNTVKDSLEYTGAFEVYSPHDNPVYVVSAVAIDTHGVKGIVENKYLNTV